MSDQSSRPVNGADPAPEPKRSVRDVAEAVYDDLMDPSSGSDDTETQAVDDRGDGRDAKGRFAPTTAAKPGEAVEPQGDPAPKSEDTPSADPTVQPAPAESGSSIELPPHWPAEDRKTFAELTPNGKELFVRRYGEMERDYTQKTQAAAQAVTFTQSVAPIFNNPHVADSLRQAGVAPSEAINQWAQFHLGIISPDPKVRVATLQEIARRAQVDPAAMAASQPGPAGLPPEVLKDPSMKLIADHIGALQKEILANRQQLQTVQGQWASRQTEEAQRVTEWQVNTFADEVDGQGNKLRPHFDRVIGEIMLLYKGDPENFDIGRAYQRACYLNDAVREEMQQAGRQTAAQQASNQRAAQAAKSNLRGRTTPVAGSNGSGEKRSLRETLEAAADDAGIN